MKDKLQNFKPWYMMNKLQDFYKKNIFKNFKNFENFNNLDNFFNRHKIICKNDMINVLENFNNF